MTSDLNLAFSRENLERAWLWTLTNREAHYKSYFRQIYRAYSLSQGKHLASLRKNLLNGIFLPTHATKIYFPKKSGLQRAYSLLAVEDQIVYQALVNIIGDQLFRKMREHYYKSVFGNLYAGKRSKFFFNDWRTGYVKFSKALRSEYKRGLRYTATFDLTACYDSIDHSVLKHFLSDLGLDVEFSSCLTDLLKHWTASSTDTPIYQGHGIPQGPQPSGLLAEVVLNYFDQYMHNDPNVRYFRYVDDIRLFAESEAELRRALVKLDLLSRDVGLFPQTSKIRIHRVQSIEDEIKSISNPPEEVTQTADPDQQAVRARLQELTRNLSVSNETRFKYVLGRAAPNAELAKRLLLLVEREPHLYQSIFRYLEKFPKFTKVLSMRCLDLLTAYDLYPAFTSALLRAIRGRIHHTSRQRLKTLCLQSLKIKQSNPELRVAAATALLHYNWLPPSEVPKQILWKRDWWVRSELLPFLNESAVGKTAYYKLANHLMRDRCLDVSLVAAELVTTKSITLEKPTARINPSAQIVLREAGLIGRIRSKFCPVSEAMVDLLGTAVRPINWKRVLGKQYKPLVRMIVGWRGYGKSDASGWVNVSDTVNDLILEALFFHDTTIGKYTIGKIGSVLTPTSRFATKYPQLFDAVSDIHDARLESALSHAVVKNTGRQTRYIRFKEMEPLKRKLRKGYLELWSKW